MGFSVNFMCDLGIQVKNLSKVISTLYEVTQVYIIGQWEARNPWSTGPTGDKSYSVPKNLTANFFQPVSFSSTEDLMCTYVGSSGWVFSKYLVK